MDESETRAFFSFLSSKLLHLLYHNTKYMNNQELDLLIYSCWKFTTNDKFAGLKEYPLITPYI